MIFHGRLRLIKSSLRSSWNLGSLGDCRMTDSFADHDQRLKVLLKEFFEQFFLCFFPVWAARFDFTNVTWLDKELFLTPPQGEKRLLDLVARLRLLPDAPPLPVPGGEMLAVVHIEVESRDSIQP